MEGKRIFRKYGSMSRGSAFPKKFHEFFQFRACRSVARNGAEERGELGEQFLVFQNVVGDRPASTAA
jgi:hypothetical protein